MLQSIKPAANGLQQSNPDVPPTHLIPITKYDYSYHAMLQQCWLQIQDRQARPTGLGRSTQSRRLSTYFSILHTARLQDWICERQQCQETQHNFHGVLEDLSSAGMLCQQSSRCSKVCTATHIIASLLEHLDAILKGKAQVFLLVLERLERKLLSYQL